MVDLSKREADLRNSFDDFVREVIPKGRATSITGLKSNVEWTFVQTPPFEMKPPRFHQFPRFAIGANRFKGETLRRNDHSRKFSRGGPRTRPAARSYSITPLDGNKLPAQPRVVYYPHCLRGVARTKKRWDAFAARSDTRMQGKGEDTGERDPLLRAACSSEEQFPLFPSFCEHSLLFPPLLAAHLSVYLYPCLRPRLLVAADYRLARSPLAKWRRYDDINLTCTRAHCYDNVFKCQP